MIIYVAGTIVSMFFAWMAAKTKNISSQKRKKYFPIFLMIMSILPLCIISAVRYDVGTDYLLTYKVLFYRISQGTDQFNEIGFNLLCKLILNFTNDSVWLFVITSILFSIFIYAGIFKNSKNAVVSIFILLVGCFFLESMNLIRQYIAMAIFVYAIRFIFENNFKKYLFWIIVASLFHSIALIYIPIYFIVKKMKINMRNTLVSLIGVLIASNILQKIIIFIASYTKYSWYFQSKFNTGEFYIFSTIINFIILIIGLMYKYSYENNTRIKIMTNLQYICVLICCCSNIIPQALRLITCFSIVQIIYIPELINNEKNSKTKIILLAIIGLIYIIYMIYSLYFKGAYGVLPYKTIWN